MKHLKELIVEKIKITNDSIDLFNIDTIKNAVMFIVDNIIINSNQIKESDIYKYMKFNDDENDFIYKIDQKFIKRNITFDIFKEINFGKNLSIKKNKERFYIKEINNSKSVIFLEMINNEIREIYFTNNVKQILINL